MVIWGWEIYQDYAAVFLILTHIDQQPVFCSKAWSGMTQQTLEGMACVD